MLKATDILQRSPNATHQMVGDEAILIDLNTNAYYSLNDTGAMFWDLLDGQRSIADCAQAIAAEYDVSATEVEADLLDLAEEFRGEGLVVG